MTGDLEVICLLPLACPGLPFIFLQAFKGWGESRKRFSLISSFVVKQLLCFIIWFGNVKKIVFLSGHRCCHKHRGYKQPLWWIRRELWGSALALPCPCTENRGFNCKYQKSVIAATPALPQTRKCLFFRLILVLKQLLTLSWLYSLRVVLLCVGWFFFSPKSSLEETQNSEVALL